MDGRGAKKIRLSAKGNGCSRGIKALGFELEVLCELLQVWNGSVLLILRATAGNAQSLEMEIETN